MVSFLMKLYLSEIENIYKIIDRNKFEKKILSITVEAVDEINIIFKKII